VHSAPADEPRRCFDTLESKALVELVAVPPQDGLSEHCTTAPAWETLTGPDTAATAASAAAGSRSSTVLSLVALHPPPAPCTAQLDEPLLARTPLTSPDAAPEVAESAVPSQPAPAQLARASARLAANNAESDPSDTAASLLPDGEEAPPTCELDSAEHPPADVPQLEDPLVVRFADRTPSAAAPVTVRPVALAPLPLQPTAPAHSTLTTAATARSALDSPCSPSPSPSP
jgi:hypothetical protein